MDACATRRGYLASRSPTPISTDAGQAEAAGVVVLVAERADNFLGFVAARGVSCGNACACHRARRPGAPRPRRQLDPAPARLARVAIRVSLRVERRHAQSGQRCRAAADGKRRRQDAGARRSPDPQAARCARGRHGQEQAGPRHPLDAAISRAAAKGAMQAQGERRAAPRKGVPHLKVSGEGGSRGLRDLVSPA